jgi:NMD protein affecting ribosome stability and mRNA decay
MEEKLDNYYQGVLQLRDIKQNALDFVEELLEEKHLTKVRAVKNGYDFYIRDNSFLLRLGKQLKARFLGELTTTKKLHTRDNQTCKNVYRVTVLFRQYDIQKGDVYLINGEEYEVLGVGDKIRLKEKSTLKKKLFTFQQIKKLKGTKINP